MSVPFHDLASGTEGQLIESVGKLAEPASDRRDQAPLPELATLDEPSPPDRPPDLFPEAEYLLRRDEDAVDLLDRSSQVFDLSERELLLCVVTAPQRTAHLSDYGFRTGGYGLVARNWMYEIAYSSTRSEYCGLEEE